jgi:hypothetical protein
VDRDCFGSGTGCSGFGVMPLLSPLMHVVGDVYFWGMFFVRVNQVLVRLWARCGSKSDRMVCVLRGNLVRDGRPAVVALCSEATVVC